MSLNSLFFNYDKLAKDGVIETIDWRNPPDSDDDSSGDDGIRTLDETVNDVNDKIKRSDDIAADLKRTIDSIKQSGKVSQEDRITLEAFTKSVDFKGLPSMESYTMAPSSVNYEKTLSVSMEIHKALVAGGMAALVLLIAKVISWFTGEDDGGAGGGGGSGDGSGKKDSRPSSPAARAMGTKQIESKLVKTEELFDSALDKIKQSSEGLSHESIEAIKKASKLSDDQIKKQFDAVAASTLIKIVKRGESIFGKRQSIGEVIQKRHILHALMLAHLIRNHVTEFDQLSINKSSVGLNAVNKLKQEVTVLLKTYEKVTDAVNAKRLDEVNKIIHEYRPTWQNAYSSAAVPEALGIAKNQIVESLNAKIEDEPTINKLSLQIVNDLLFERWGKSYVCEAIGDVATNLNDLKSRLETLKHQVDTDDSKEVNATSKHIQHLINLTTPQMTLMIKVNNHYSAILDKIVSFISHAENFSTEFNNLNKHIRNEI